MVCEPGWRRRGLSTSLPFDPKNVVWHHDGSAKGASPGVVAFMLSRFATAAAQAWVCMGCDGAHPIGTWHVLASGRAPHTGPTLPGMPTNYDSLGVETDHTTGESWHPDQLRSLRVGTAAILEKMRRRPSRALHFHKTICSPPGRKTDPDGLDLSMERVRVGALMGRATVSLSAVRRAAQRGDASAPRATAIVQRELRAAGLLRGAYVPGRFGPWTRAAYAGWQAELGYRGRGANGIPGEQSLRALGRHRYKFRVEG